MNAQVIVGATVVLAVVFGVAGVGKMLAPNRHFDVVVGGLEVVLAIGLASGLVPALIAVSAFLVTLIYAAHAFRPLGRPCSCFGDRLPQTTVWAQRWRNGLLLTVAAFLVVLRLQPTPSLRNFPALAITIGAVVAAALIAGPWMATWLRPAELPRTN
jgi:hypothetical protein